MRSWNWRAILRFFAFEDFINPLMRVFGKAMFIIIILAAFAVYDMYFRR